MKRVAAVADDQRRHGERRQALLVLGHLLVAEQPGEDGGGHRRVGAHDIAHGEQLGHAPRQREVRQERARSAEPPARHAVHAGQRAEGDLPDAVAA